MLNGLLNQVTDATRKGRRVTSQLIDNYAEGLIEKVEFEPRIKRLKRRLTTLRQFAARRENRGLHSQQSPSDLKVRPSRSVQNAMVVLKTRLVTFASYAQMARMASTIK